MKRIIALISILILVLFVTGCGKPTEAPSDNVKGSGDMAKLADTQEDKDVQDLETGLNNLDSLEEDLNLSDLDNLDEDLNFE